MRFIANNLAMICAAFIFLSCAADGASVQTPSSTGIGRDRFSTLAQNIIADMRNFFSQQTVYQSKDDCPVRIMLDPQKLDNESSERVNFDLFVNGFRDHFNDRENEKQLRLTGRKIAFVDIKRRLIAGAVAARKCRAQKLGADYLLAGRIISDDKINRQDIRQTQTLISFWLLDLETGAKTWTSPSYTFKSFGQNDVIYQ